MFQAPQKEELRSRAFCFVLFRFFPSHFLSRPSFLSSSRNSAPGSHGRLFSRPPHQGSCHAFLLRENFSSSLVDPRRIVPTRARRSQQLILSSFLQICSKSDHGGIRTPGPTLLIVQHSRVTITRQPGRCPVFFSRACTVRILAPICQTNANHVIASLAAGAVRTVALPCYVQGFGSRAWECCFDWGWPGTLPSYLLSGLYYSSAGRCSGTVGGKKKKNEIE